MPPPNNNRDVSQALPIRVGVADDHSLFLDVLCQGLSQEKDIEVVARARDGDEALGLLRDHRPDVLLLDLHMPGLDGIATLQQIRAMRFRTRVLLLTATSDGDGLVEALLCGAGGIISKHSAADLMAKGIRKVHQGRVWLDGDSTAAMLRQFHKPEAVATPGQEAGSEKIRTAASVQFAPRLTQREREIVGLLTQGLHNNDIADRLNLRQKTVKNHLSSVFQKLQVSDRLELALYAIQSGVGWMR